VLRQDHEAGHRFDLGFIEFLNIEELEDVLLFLFDFFGVGFAAEELA
jgi:hypothetical protein